MASERPNKEALQLLLSRQNLFWERFFCIKNNISLVPVCRFFFAISLGSTCACYSLLTISNSFRFLNYLRNGRMLVNKVSDLNSSSVIFFLLGRHFPNASHHGENDAFLGQMWWKGRGNVGGSVPHNTTNRVCEAKLGNPQTWWS